MKQFSCFVILYLFIFQQISARGDYVAIQQKIDEAHHLAKIALENLKSLKEAAVDSVDSLVILWKESTTSKLDDLKEEIQEMGLDIDEGILECLRIGEDGLKQLLITTAQKTHDCVSEIVDEISDFELTMVLQFQTAYEIDKRFTSHTCKGPTLACMDQMKQDMVQLLSVLEKGNKTLSKFQDKFAECVNNNYVLLNSTFQDIYVGTIKCIAPNILALFSSPHYNISIVFQKE